MSLVATLISNPASPAIDASLLKAAADGLSGPKAPQILAEGIAADLSVADGFTADAAEAALRKVIAGRPVDVFVQPREGRRKSLLIADMDSTMIQQECIDELAAELGLKDKISAITERAMRGEIDFEPALRERVALLKGLPVEAIGKVIEIRITKTPGGRELVQTMKKNGAYCALVSGGFTHFTKVIAGQIGFDENRANLLLEEDGTLLGAVEEPILGRDAKQVRLEELASELKIDLAETIAVGDGANDLAMIGRAGVGVAFHAKPAVAEIADARVDHSDLTALLYMQGYSDNEIVRD